MDPRLLRAGFRIGVLILLPALAMLPFQPPGSAEQVVTVLASIVGAVFVLGIALLARLSEPPLPDDKPRATGYNEPSTRREQ